MATEEFQAVDREVDKNRLRIYHIDRRNLVESFQFWRSPPGCVSFPKFKNLPIDYKVVEVYVNFPRRCFDLIIWSRSFDPVSPSEMVPEFYDDLGLEYEVYRVVKD